MRQTALPNDEKELRVLISKTEKRETLPVLVVVDYVRQRMVVSKGAPKNLKVDVQGERGGDY
jgi:hypothetical protein